jgi:hypothetical protein
MDAVQVEYWEEPDQYVIPNSILSLAFDPPVPPSPSRVHWHHYIQTFPVWGQELLFSVTIVDRSRLFTALRSTEVLLLASDGGDIDKLGSYGALMATQDHILIECGGASPKGQPPILPCGGIRHPYDCTARVPAATLLHHPKRFTKISAVLRQ